MNQHLLPSSLPDLSGAGAAGPDGLQRQSLLRIWYAFRLRWWVPLTVTGLALALLTVYSIAKPPEYVATGLVQLGMYSNLNQDRGLARTDQMAIMETHRQLLTSHRVVEEAIKNSGRELKQGSARLEQREDFLRRIEIEPRRNTFLVEVTARGRDAEDVVERVNALMNAFVPFTNEFLSGRYELMVRQLKTREKSLLEDLQKARRQETDFFARAGNQNFAAQRQWNRESQQQFQERLNALKIQRAQLEAEVGGLSRYLEDLDAATVETNVEVLARRMPTGEPITRPAYDTIKDRYTQAEATLNADSPEVITLSRRLATERAAFLEDLKREAQARIKGLRERDRTFSSEEQRLNSDIEAYTNELKRLQTLEATYLEVRQEVEWYERELEATRAELRGAQALLEDDSGGALVINRAEIPFEAEARFKPVMFLFVAILSFGLGLVIVVFWDHLDDTLGREEEALQLGQILGRVPYLDFRDMDEKGHLHGSSWVSEAFGLIRTNITVAARGIHKSAILVTSGSPRDGKSFVSANLAASFMRTGGRTLIIEADMRRPRIQKILGSAHEQGLADVLAGMRTPEEVIQKTEFEGLEILPSGPCPLNPADLLLRGQFKRVIQYAIENYDHVVVDAPPARPLADTSLMAPYVQGVVYVVRLRSSRRRLATGAIQQMDSVGARSLGLILNGVPPNDATAFGYYDYYASDNTPMVDLSESLPGVPAASAESIFVVTSPKFGPTPDEQPRTKLWLTLTAIVLLPTLVFFMGMMQWIPISAVQGWFNDLLGWDLPLEDDGR
ncbi:MAG: polysaccharide biosynthesis tyrosine autokinase [Planctomycetes bacterium]|nr:polysaccharide biosynthesis tyrosine autokinase [Planctomycetota bacterium]